MNFRFLSVRRLCLGTFAMLSACCDGGGAQAADAPVPIAPTASASRSPAAVSTASGAATPPAGAPGAAKSTAPAVGAKPAALVAVKAPAKTVIAPVTFDTFRFVGESNIFNPNRIGRRGDGRGYSRPTDMISFVGTMDYDKGLFAFFDGSDPTYRKALRVGESLGQFKVNKIEKNQVELSRDSKPVSLAMGQQLTRQEGADWTVSAAPPRIDKTAPAAAVPAIPSDASDVLRKLMEQRMKQLQK